jgi:hypothetical protein
MDIFETCHVINNFLLAKNELDARNELIKLLSYHESEKIEYSPLINHLIRETGLYPYLRPETALWQDKFAFEAFKVDIGGREVTLHREQSSLLKKLINKESVAVSAPTSFGKSFIIDAFIAITSPKNIVIIVPTIALTDETRRRLYKKFARKYKIITTTNVEPGEFNIFIFPQERAIGYIAKIPDIDILVIDEFYKASLDYDKERAPALLKAMIKLGKKAKQKYFLAPNISAVKENVFTKGMSFEDHLNFNTVFLQKFELYKEINGDEAEKGKQLLQVLAGASGKSLIYAASYSQIEKVATLLNENLPVIGNELLNDFSDWLTKNYDSNWRLTNLIKRGTGIHNGQLHRSLSQIEVKLFEETNGLDNLISTTSIIEGVNTSAENVIIWRNRKGGSNKKLDDFTYKNIIGRGGRMFKHFIGKIYLLEEPPENVESQLEIHFPDDILDDIDEEAYKDSLTKEQIEKIITLKNEMYDIVGKAAYDTLLRNNTLQLNNAGFIKTIAQDMITNPTDWNGLSFLNSDEVDNWERLLYKVINLQPGNWDTTYSKFVAFVKILSKSWESTIPELLDELDEFEIGIDLFFTLERTATYKFAALMNDVNEIQKVLLKKGYDISPFVSKLSHAFLPSIVYQLEEYGLPRMISRKLHQARAINVLDEQLTIHSAIELFQRIGKSQILETRGMDAFDKYIISHFFDGITQEN